MGGASITELLPKRIYQDKFHGELWLILVKGTIKK